jgi:hypothetical protein
MNREIIPQTELPEATATIDMGWGIYDCWACSICGDNDMQPFCFGDTIICDTCAGIIANHYNHAHSGAWLTWPNPPRDPYPGIRRKEIDGTKRNRIYERDAYRCRYCGSYKTLTLDHLIPVSQGGDNSDENLVACCKSCNSLKGTRTPQEAGMILLEVAEVGR